MSANQKSPAPTDRRLTQEEADAFHEELKEQTFLELVAFAEAAQLKMLELVNEIEIRDARIAQLRRRLRELEKTSTPK